MKEEKEFDNQEKKRNQVDEKQSSQAQMVVEHMAEARQME
jgi:hypothetical protein